MKDLIIPFCVIAGAFAVISLFYILITIAMDMGEKEKQQKERIQASGASSKDSLSKQHLFLVGSLCTAFGALAGYQVYKRKKEKENEKNGKFWD